MAHNGRLLARAREKLARIREENADERLRRTAEIYARIPRVKEIDARLRGQMAELVALTLRKDADITGEIRALEADSLALQRERAGLLAAAGYPSDYTEELCTCSKCRDTGLVNGEICTCLQRLYNRELTAALGTLPRCGRETFDAFDLTLYDAVPDARTGVSARDCMKLVFDTCAAYAKNFAPGAPNLLFQGGTGLGKTFLSASIAREAAARGYSVAYESAGPALAVFESLKFSREPGEADVVRSRQYLSCDLMILDDLGTEMLTAFSVSALYQLINSRLTDGRSTVISTNCGFEELRRRYGAQIASRLEGEYLLLPFAGRDIRLIKKERGE